MDKEFRAAFRENRQGMVRVPNEVAAGAAGDALKQAMLVMIKEPIDPPPTMTVGPSGEVIAEQGPATSILWRGFSPQFDPLPLGSAPPMYLVECHSFDGLLTITFRRAP